MNDERVTSINIKWSSLMSTLVATFLVLGSASTAQAATLDNIRATGKFSMGFEEAARPFSFKSENGEPAGFAVDLCASVADAVKKQIPNVAVEWIQVPAGGGISAVQSGQIDLMCAGELVTSANRGKVAFSIPILPDGIGAVIRTTDAGKLLAVLTNQEPTPRPIWRGSPARVFLDEKTFSVVTGSPSETWLEDRLSTFKLSSTVATVESYDEGVQRVVDGGTDVMFGRLSALLDSAERNAGANSLTFIPRSFTHVPVAMPMPLGDEQFRLIVDQALSNSYLSDEFQSVVNNWFGDVPMDQLSTFFQQTALPD